MMHVASNQLVIMLSCEIIISSKLSFNSGFCKKRSKTLKDGNIIAAKFLWLTAVYEEKIDNSPPCRIYYLMLLFIYVDAIYDALSTRFYSNSILLSAINYNWKKRRNKIISLNEIKFQQCIARLTEDASARHSILDLWLRSASGPWKRDLEGKKTSVNRLQLFAGLPAHKDRIKRDMLETKKNHNQEIIPQLTSLLLPRKFFVICMIF